MKVIVIIDDDEDDVYLITREVCNHDPAHQCLTFDNCVKAVEALTKLNDITPDIIFIDINMPLMKGDECLQILRHQDRLKNAFIVMFSTYISADQQQRLLDDGANLAIEKPIDFKEFKTIVKSILDRK